MDDGPLARGTVVGNYVVVDELGAGAMAVVYAAYDPSLDRRVALKVLSASGADAEAQARLLREAHALARLNHPNVVVVHDVGTHEGRVWMAMELVEGTTLTEWLREKPRRWRRIVSTFRRAGEGLRAAHAAELLHRDFKPDNVMVDRGGRVRVMDFGLVRDAGQGKAAATRETSPELDTELTAAGYVVGTPAYMSPEQISGGSIGPHSDQFSFFVALWEALYGERPFRGASVEALQVALTRGPPTPPSSGVGAPRWLRRVCERGLALDPTDRFDDMNAVLTALAAGTARARRRRAAIVLAAGGLAGLGGFAIHAEHQARKAAACQRAGAPIDELWNDDVRLAVGNGLRATELGFAAATAERVDERLGARAIALQAARIEACTNTTVGERWSEDTAAHVHWCLEENELDFRALVEEFTGADAIAAERAVAAVDSLGDPARCVDPASLRGASGPPPPQLRPQVAELRAELARARAQRAAGAASRGLDTINPVVDRARILGWPPLTAATLALKATLLQANDDLDAAAETAREAYSKAYRNRAWATAADVAVRLTHIEGYQQARLDAGLLWSYHARIANAHAGDPLSLRASTLANALGATYSAAARGDEAREQFQRAADLGAAAVGEAHPGHASTLNNLGTALRFQGEYDRARAVLERSLALKQAAFGDAHPALAPTLDNLAAVHGALGDNAAARELDARALAIREAAYGPDHPSVARALRNLAIDARHDGDFDDAEALLQRALALTRKAHGADHPLVAKGLMSLAVVNKEQGDFPEAERQYKQALAIAEARLGPDHTDVADTLNNLGILYADSGRPDDARAAHRRALAVREARLGPEHRDVGVSLHNLGSARQVAGLDDDQTSDYLSRALAIYEQTLGPDHPTVARVLGNLGNFHRRRGELEQAEDRLRRALEIRKNVFGADHHETAAGQLLLAEVELARGDKAAALDRGHRALTVLQAIEGTQPFEPQTNFFVAKLLLDRDRTAALALAHAAVSGYRDFENADGAGRVGNWIEKHGGRR